jgi:2',3'-cyclic-nucleotide 2'-phosphodiesterase (5'-nucleotidase family)
MAQNEIIMKIRLIILSLALSAVTLSAQDYTWEPGKIDGSRTGCGIPSTTNVEAAVGKVVRGKYYAPDGSIFKKNSATARTASLVLDAQPAMARVKEVVAHSTREMSKGYPESELSNWFVDIMIRKAEALSGSKVHMGIVNFGGIRADMPEGDVILDDLFSMFPFKNQITYVEHKGSTIRSILENMAAGRFQVLGGVRVVAQDGRLVSVEIDGQPLEDDKVYGLATVNFLLYGGDGLKLAEDAVNLVKYDVDVIDAVLEHVYAETAAGRPIEYQTDGRVTIIRKMI